MILSVQGFSGVAPKLAPHALRDNQAQTALNTRLWTGILEPMPDKVDLLEFGSQGGTVVSMHLNGSSVSHRSWRLATTPTHYCKTQIAGDTTGRVYYTDGGMPKMSDATLGPDNYYAMGIPAPSTSPTVFVSQSGSYCASVQFDAGLVAAGDTIDVIVNGTTTTKTVVTATAAAIATLLDSVTGANASATGNNVIVNTDASGVSASLKLVLNHTYQTYEGATETLAPEGTTLVRTYTEAQVASLFPVGRYVLREYQNDALTQTITGDIASSTAASVAAFLGRSSMLNVQVGSVVTFTGGGFGNEYFSADVTATGMYVSMPEAASSFISSLFKSLFGIGVVSKSVTLHRLNPVTATQVTQLGSATGLGSEEVTETVAYTYTYVRNYNGWQEESAPSPVGSLDCKPSDVITLNGFESVPSGPYNITHRRIYRTSTGSQGTNYYFVGEQPVANTSFVDSVQTENLGEVIPSLEWDAPPEGLRHLTALPNGVFAAFKEKDVYFCEPFMPHAWPAKYIQTVGYDIVGLAAFGTSLLVLTKGTPYLIQGGDPSTNTMVKLDLEQSCVSARSIVPFENGVMYASPDGLVYVSSGATQIVTQPYLTSTDWRNIFGASFGALHAAQHDGRYYGFHPTGGFIFDPNDQSGAFTMHNVVADACFPDIETDLLYIISGSRLSGFGFGGPKSYTWKSKVFQLPYEMNMAAIQVIAQSYSNLTLTFWADGVQKLSVSVTSSAPIRLPSGYRGRFVEFQLVGTDKVNQVHLADSMMEFKRV